MSIIEHRLQAVGKTTGMFCRAPQKAQDKPSGFDGEENRRRKDDEHDFGDSFRAKLDRNSGIRTFATNLAQLL
jgi:hypothetical protein